MKNGVNIAAASETAFEISEFPEEADVRFAVSGSWLRNWSGAISVSTIKLGTKRHARDFSLGFDLPYSLGGGGRSPAPQEYLLAGVASCAMLVIVEGASVKGLTIRSLDIEAYAAATGESREADSRLVVRLDAEGSRAQHEELVANIRTLSPNYNTLSTSNRIRLSAFQGPLASEAADQYRKENAVGFRLLSEETLSAGRSVQETYGVGLSWRHGFQIDATSGRSGGDAPVHRFVIDQPFPYGGLDEAPNPQEYLLAALSADLVQCVRTAAQELDCELDSVEAKSRGAVDLRGFFNVGSSSPSLVKLDAIEAELVITGMVPAGTIEELMKRASELSVVCRALSVPQEIALDLA